MTSLRKRLDNILCELKIIQDALKKPGRYPPCCLKIYSDGRVGCDVVPPLPEKEFLKECQKCKARILRLITRMKLNGN
jgi:hypothetical protein